MHTMPGMPMPGGWTMSMMWMRMPAQSWAGFAGGFIVMWTIMMGAMMLPTLIPMLWRYRRAIRSPLAGALTVTVAAGYFLVWTATGCLTLAAGSTFAAAEMSRPGLARLVPLAAALLLVLAGLLQFSRWKLRHLACCGERPRCAGSRAAPFTSAWRHGLRLGWHCNACCAPLTCVLLVLGVMDLRVMGLVTAAIMLERMSPAGARMARFIGLIVIVTGLSALQRSAGA